MSDERGTVLVTGGLGYVGSRLVPHLLERGRAVRVLDMALYGEGGLRALEADPRWSEWRRRFTLVRGDLRDPAAVAEALDGAGAVVHLAAISNDPTGEVDEVLTRQVNFDAVGMLLAQARSAGVRRFINASSSSVFGIKDTSDVVEHLEPEPLTTYSRYKALSEWLVIASRAPDFVTVNVRPATICGWSPRQRFDLTVNKLTLDAITKRLITVHGGQQRRPNVSMEDVIDLYERLLVEPAQRINGQTFNFGFENLKIIEIAELIQRECRDLGPRVEVTDTLDRRDYHISSTKLVEALDLRPRGSIARAVAELRAKIEAGAFPDPTADEHYNMKSMRLARRADCYAFLAAGAS